MKKNYILAILAILFTGIVQAQIVQVTDINATGNAGIGSPVTFNGEVYFEADDGVIGDELYKIKADGTVELVKDINTDADDTSPNGDPKNFIEYKGKLYFAGNDGDKGADKHDTELWVTDGTTDGTMMVEDIWPGGDGNGSNPQQMFVFNDKLYFNAKVDGANQIFRYDGETPVVKITSSRDNGSAVPFFPVVDEANGKAYVKMNTNGKFHLLVLSADESYIEIEKNATDHGFAGIEGGVIYKDKYYYQGDNGTDGDELFVSDGTDAGTFMLKDIFVGDDADPEQFTIYNDELYFIAEVATGMQLWKTDGTAEGTVMAAEPFVGGDADMDYLTLYNDKLYFAATDGTSGVQVWSYDGTSASIVKNIYDDGTDSNPEGFTVVDDLLFFAADDTIWGNERLWVTDGTESGTMPVDSIFAETEVPTDVVYSEFVTSGSMFYFTGDDENGDEIFTVDAKDVKEAMNTGQVTDINKNGDSGIGSPFVWNGELYFEADDGVIGDELYKIKADGTVELVKDINTDADDTSPNGDPKNFIEYKGKLYFAGNDGDKGADKHDTELWVTDGTTDGTMMVEDIWPGGDGNGSNPQQMFVFNDKLYFNAKVDGANQIFRYDGQNPVVKITSSRDNGSAVPFFPVVDEANGKAYVKMNTNGKFHLLVLSADESYIEIEKNATDHGFAGIEGGVIYKDKYYYQGDNGTDGDELFVSDGTDAGTFMLKDIFVGDDADPEQFTIYNDELYFIAEVATGMQLWKTDGTAEGTVMAAEPFVDGNADMDYLTLYNDKLYFSATDGANGVEVWSYDGTSASMLKDLDAEATSSDPQGFTVVDGLLFFVADATGEGDILWVTNGEPDYTVSIASLTNMGIPPIKVNEGEFAVNGSILYYTADDVNGNDDIYMIDAKTIFSEDVIFTVTDANGPLAGAEVVLLSDTVYTDDSGIALFPYVRMGTDLAYSVSLDDYISVDGTVTVADATVEESVVMQLEPKYSVTFTVTDGTNALEGAVVTFNGGDQTTDASGEAVFTEIKAGTALPYSVTLNYRYYDADGTVDVDGDETVNVTLALTSANDAMMNSMEVYPNPTNGRIYVQGVQEGASYELYNVGQQKIAEGILSGKEINLDTETGVYILKVVSDDKVYLKKLIIK